MCHPQISPSNKNGHHHSNDKKPRGKQGASNQGLVLVLMLTFQALSDTGSIRSPQPFLPPLLRPASALLGLFGGPVLSE